VTTTNNGGAADRRWPDFFIVGAAKAGTTSLFDSLTQHPEVFTPRVKEPHHFSTVAPPPERKAFFPSVRDEREYLALFAGARAEQVVGEASTSYLWDPEAAARIHSAAPGARTIAMLRDPVERAWSHYLNDVREGFETRSFDDAIEADVSEPDGIWGDASLYVQLGFYTHQLRRYVEKFPDTLVLFFEEFVRDVPGHLDRTCDFLGVTRFDDAAAAARTSNEYARPRNRLARATLGHGGVRVLARTVAPQRVRTFVRGQLQTKEPKPAMPTDARARLESLYAGEAEALRKLLGRDVPWDR
jgi:sulfotransferase family protein